MCRTIHRCSSPSPTRSRLSTLTPNYELNYTSEAPLFSYFLVFLANRDATIPNARPPYTMTHIHTRSPPM